jgi:hypothetical protein
MSVLQEAIQVNQIWAGHPGAQQLSGIGDNQQVEVWTKPLGAGRIAALVVNTQNKGEVEHQSAAGRAATVAVQAQDGTNTLQLVHCDDNAESQRWNLTATADAVTNISPAGSKTKQCWSIHACDTKPEMSVEIADGCKKLPDPAAGGCKNLCSCNDAWRYFEANKTIVSYMDGQCLTAGGGNKVALQPCNDTLDKWQQWQVRESTTEKGSYRIASMQQGGMCADGGSTAPPGPPHPPGTPTLPANVTFKLSALGLGFSGAVKVRDVWNKKNLLGSFDADSSFTTMVPFHGSTFFVFMKPGSVWPEPFKLAPWLDKPAPPVPPHA